MDDITPDAVVAAVVIASSGAGRNMGVAVLAPRARKSRSDRAQRTMTLLQFADEDGFVWLQSLLQAHGVSHLYVSDNTSPNDVARLRLALDSDDDAVCVDNGWYSRRSYMGSSSFA